MGKSGGRKKKTAANPTAGDHPIPSKPAAVPASSTGSAAAASAAPTSNGVDPSLQRAHELKEEGNRRFQSHDYPSALNHYDAGLRLLPASHPDRAVLHSNRAACLMQMRPVDHAAVADECSLALQSQPRFPRALLRRARAFESLSRHDLALQDVNALLALDPSHRDALDLAARLRAALDHSQQHHHSRPSAAALGASAALGAPISGLGPSLPSRPLKKPSPTPPPSTAKPDKLPNHSITTSSSNPPIDPGPTKPLPLTMPKPAEASSPAAIVSRAAKIVRWRPLKLVYGHDIRLSQMPVQCSFRELREIVARRFPSSKSILIKYKDADGDLVTVTSTAELRAGESSVDRIGSKVDRDEGIGSKVDGDEGLGVLRLHVVEVSPEQEPPLPEEEEEKEEEEEEVKVVENEGLVKENESGSQSPPAADSTLESLDNGGGKGLEEILKEKAEPKESHSESKEVEIDDWLLEFAQLFRNQVGIDPDAHLDLHELGMELCSEALEETVTSKEAQSLFEMAAAKFQEVAALAFFNWGNVHMCAARKRIPLDESSPKEVMAVQLRDAYDWVRDRYALAGEKYEEALRIKPDFYEGLLALGQQHFETAKLHWSFALANKVDLTTWDSSETIKLFDTAEEKMKAATEMWEKVEEQRNLELKDPGTNKMDEFLKKRKKQGVGVDGQGEVSADEAAEQAAVMRSQIHLFWGNMLFERSQVEYKLGFGDWKKNLDAATERFRLAGASEADISVVLKNHLSNVVDAESDGKKVVDLNAELSETASKDEDKPALKN